MDLATELERQADIYIGLGVNKDVIMRLLAPRPDGLPEYLNIPVVVLGKSVDLERQCKFGGIRLRFNPSECSDYHGGITFDKPHLLWMQEGNRYKGIKQGEFVYHLSQDKYERPATIYDGVAFAIVRPGFRDPNLEFKFRKFDIKLLGTMVGRATTECPYIQGQGTRDLDIFKGDIQNSGEADGGGVLTCSR